ncbi:hypothetical protein [Roseateles toxinivorans]|uniref:Uncharacterized protein n=1 Tax=Roseateles toxinivorans TaxID=270368 RepID=A0A4R6QKL3_9BURK|nr:hypothetical protein [Roseateles toxinivorans]TDP64120.1 hypothetical protein DES47_104409 [Roseateles toxinivorans]
MTPYSSASTMAWDTVRASIELDHLALAEQLRHCHPRRSPWRTLLGSCERAQAFVARRAVSLLLLALVVSACGQLSV